MQPKPIAFAGDQRKSNRERSGTDGLLKAQGYIRTETVKERELTEKRQDNFLESELGRVEESALERASASLVLLLCTGV